MKEKEIQITFNPRTRVTLARMFELPENLYTLEHYRGEDE